MNYFNRKKKKETKQERKREREREREREIPNHPFPDLFYKCYLNVIMIIFMH
jgi:hypothetical protein